MARKTKEDAAITREQLLDAAETVFRQRGVARSSLAEVAAAAGVTRGAVYWHFRDKADLCSAMCERAMLPLETLLSDAAAAEHDDPLGMLRDLALGALMRLAQDPRSQAVFEVLLHESERTAEMAPMTARRQRERRHCLAHVEDLLQQAVGKGQLPKDTDTRADNSGAARVHRRHHEQLGARSRGVRPRGVGAGADRCVHGGPPCCAAAHDDAA